MIFAGAVLPVRRLRVVDEGCVRDPGRRVCHGLAGREYLVIIVQRMIWFPTYSTLDPYPLELIGV